MQSYYKNLARTKENPPASTWEPDFSKSRILIERFYKDQDDFRDALAKRVEFEIQQIRSAHTKFEIDDSNDEINEHRIYKEEFTPNGTTRYNFVKKRKRIFISRMMRIPMMMCQNEL